MNFIMNKDKFTDIEDAFTRLKANNTDVAATRKLADALRSLTGKTFEVTTISPTNKSQECTVMSVYPDESAINKVVQNIVSEDKDAMLASMWQETDKWTIEIDTRILTNDVGLTEKELTSLLLHEVGHVIYSNSIPKRISGVMRMKYVTSPAVAKSILKDDYFSKILSFPILNACNTTTHRTSLKKEIIADKYSINAGYGKDLQSAMDKIIAYAGSDSSPDKDMGDLMGFSIENILMLQKRQNKAVKKNMVYMVASTPSRFATNVANKFITGLDGNKDGGSVTEAVKEKILEKKLDQLTSAVYESYEKYTTEAFLFRPKRMKKLDPADIDYIGLEVNNVKSNDDKMMIVSYIYSKLDQIDYYIALIDSKNPKYIIPHSRESLVSMRNTLEKYRQDVITRKLPEVTYGISVGYPTGYEG